MVPKPKQFIDVAHLTAIYDDEFVHLEVCRGVFSKLERNVLDAVDDEAEHPPEATGPITLKVETFKHGACGIEIGLIGVQDEDQVSVIMNQYLSSNHISETLYALLAIRLYK